MGGGTGSPQEPWAIRTAGDEATRAAGQNLRDWAKDDRTPLRRFVDRARSIDDRDPKLSGAFGEELVGNELATLGEGWTVIHGVRIGAVADVDHLVIGPPGVFCLNTKRIAFDARIVVSARQFRVNGYRRDYYPKSVAEARRIEARVKAAVGAPVPVWPLLVLVSHEPRRLRVEEQPADLTVVARKRIVRWLLRLPAMLTPAQVAILTNACRRPSTWDPTKVAVVLDRVPAAEPPPPPADVVLAPWKRYGHHRLYARCARTQHRLGWRDEVTGAVHVEPDLAPADVARLQVALRARAVTD